MPWRPAHLRTRLTLWYMAILAALLILAWISTCALLFFQLAQPARSLLPSKRSKPSRSLFYFTPAGDLRLRDDYHNHPESKDVIERYLEVRSRTRGRRPVSQ